VKKKISVLQDLKDLRVFQERMELMDPTESQERTESMERTQKSRFNNSIVESASLALKVLQDLLVLKADQV